MFLGESFDPEVRFQEHESSSFHADYTPAEPPKSNWLHASNVKRFAIGGAPLPKETTWGGNRPGSAFSSWRPNFRRSDSMSTASSSSPLLDGYMASPGLMPPPQTPSQHKKKNLRPSSLPLDPTTTPVKRRRSMEYRNRVRCGGGVPRIRFDDEIGLEEGEEQEEAEQLQRRRWVIDSDDDDDDEGKENDAGSPLANPLSSSPPHPLLRRPKRRMFKEFPVIKVELLDDDNDDVNDGNDGQNLAIVRPMSSMGNSGSIDAGGENTPLPSGSGLLIESPSSHASQSGINCLINPPVSVVPDEVDYDEPEIIDEETLLNLQSQKHLIGKKF